MADPFTIGAGISIGSSLLGSLFGGESEAEKAQKMLLKFAKSGLPPDLKQQIIGDALAAIERDIRSQESSIGARLAAGGIDTTSGLAQSQFGKARRAGMTARGKAVGNINMQEFQQRMDALKSVVGGGDQSGFNFLETLASTSGNILPLLALRGGGGGNTTAAAINTNLFANTGLRRSTSGVGAGVDPFGRGLGAGVRP